MGGGYWDFSNKSYKESEGDKNTKERKKMASKRISSTFFLDKTAIESDDLQEEYEVEYPNDISVFRKFVKHHLRKNLEQLQMNISMIVFMIATHNVDKKDDVLIFHNDILKDINFATLDLCDDSSTVERLLQSTNAIYKKINIFLRKHCYDSKDIKEDKELFDLAKMISNDIKRMVASGFEERGARDFRFIDI